MHTHPPPDRSDSHGPLRVVGLDGTPAAIPGRPHIVLSRKIRACERMALADSGLLEACEPAAPGSGGLKLVRAESDDNRGDAAGDERVPTIAIGPRVRRFAVNRDGAA